MILAYWIVRCRLPEIDQAKKENEASGFFGYAGSDSEDDDEITQSFRDRPSASASYSRTADDILRDGKELTAITKTHLKACGFPYFDGTEFRASLIEKGRISENENDLFFVIALPMVEAEWCCYPEHPESRNGAMWDMIAALTSGRGVSTDGDIEEPEDGEVHIFAWPLVPTLADLSMSEVLERVRATVPELAPSPGESESDWVTRMLLTEERLDEMWERWIDVGCDRYSFARSLPPTASTVSQGVSFLVDGLVQRNAITIVVAAAGTGKSTGLAELAVGVAANEPGRTWMAQPIVSEESRRQVIYIAGEDAAETVDFWRAKYGDTSRKLISYPQDGRTFAQFVELIERMRNVALVIIDPARYYLAGGEMSDDKVNEFLLLVARLIRNTGVAVILTHHLGKNADPKKASDFLSDMRGLQLWIDRARMIIGMRKNKDQVIVSVVKHNVPPQFPVMPERTFRQDSQGLRLIPLEAGQPQPVSSADQLRVLQEIRAFNGAGVKVFKSGKRGLYAQAADRLPGLSRDTVIAIIGDLMGLEAVRADAEGALIASVPGVPPERSVTPEGFGTGDERGD
jgi:hypothetical protein